MTFLILILIGYFIGSIPSSYLSMRFFTGKDIRTLGTGNATVTAVLMYGGKRPALVAFIGEMAKSGICLLIAYLWLGERWAYLTVLIAAVFGCSWSLWLRGGGGQGMTIGVTGLVLINVLAVLIMATSYLLSLAITKRRILSNRMFRISIPTVLGLWYTSWEYALAGCLLVMPSFIKEWVAGDDVVAARKVNSVG